MIIRSTRSLALALALLVPAALPTFAHSAQQAKTFTKTFNLTLHGDVPAGESFGIDYAVHGGYEEAPLYFCGPDIGTPCTSNGTVHTRSIQVPQNAQLLYRFYRGHEFSPDFEEFNSGQEAMIDDSTSNAVYTFAPSATPTPQPDTVVKAFQLTLNGTPPADAAFSVLYGEQFNRAALVFCGTVETDVEAPCVGNGTVYTKNVQVPRGSTVFYTYNAFVQGGAEVEVLADGSEVMDANKTNSATYTFASAKPSPTVKPAAPPAQLPDTGAPALPLGGVVMAGVALLAGGWAARKRR